MPRPHALLGRHLLDRRGFLAHMATGVGGIALSSILIDQGLLAADSPALASGRLAPRAPQFPAKARRVLHIFCTGAVSHLDTWDYKPELIKRHGQPMPGSGKLITFQGENGALAKSPWAFKPRGQSGKYTSDLLPHLSAHVDDLCFIHSLTSKTNTHGPGEMFMSTGFTLEGFPSMGAWVSYALGTENQDLPAYVAIPDPRGDPQQGPANWTNGFLPAVYQGTSFNDLRPISHLARPSEISLADDRATTSSSACSTIFTCSTIPAMPTCRPGSPRTSWQAGCREAPPKWVIYRKKVRQRALSLDSTLPIPSLPRSAAIVC